MYRMRIFPVLFTLVFAVTVLPAQAQEPDHCVIRLSSVARPENFDPTNVDPSLHSEVLAETCFDTFSEAISFATNGRVRLRNNATRSEVATSISESNAALEETQTSGIIVPQATYAIAVVFDWIDHNYTGGNGSRTIVGGYTCNTQSYFVTNISSTLGSAWANSIESALIYSPCSAVSVYDSINFAGSNVICNTPCYSMGAMRNKGESFIFY